jgi:hypothetical protein
MKWVALSFGTVALAGCSLGQFVGQSADDYHKAMADHDLLILTSNIMRAHDFLPLNFSQLSTITGSLSTTASVVGTFPFKPLNGAMSANSWSPTLTATSSPTFTMGALSVQGFTLGILQPISPTYIENKWHGPISRELLLLLFVKEVSFPVYDAKGNVTKVNVYKNNPDDPKQMAAFRYMLFEMMKNLDINIKITTVLEPVGAPFPYFAAPAPTPAGTTGTQTCSPTCTSMQQDPVVLVGSTAAIAAQNHTWTITPGGQVAIDGTVDNTTSEVQELVYADGEVWQEDNNYLWRGKSTPNAAWMPQRGTKTSPPLVAAPAPMQPPTQLPQTIGGSTRLDGITFATGLSDGQYHVGNTSDPTALIPGLQPTWGGQLYRTYPSQVALCLDNTSVNFPVAPPAPAGTSSASHSANAVAYAAHMGGGQQPTGASPAASAVSRS